MTLSYRGTSYNTSTTQIATTESSLTGNYRGHKVHFNNPVQQQHPAALLMYRGSAY